MKLKVYEVLYEINETSYKTSYTYIKLIKLEGNTQNENQRGDIRRNTHT